MADEYPLVFEPILLEKVWGGDRLSRFGKPVTPGSRVGESWEIADLRETSSSGAGGGAKRSIVANGSMAGRTLGEVIEAWGDGLIESSKLTATGGFPLLVKLLDAREHLSVQVHPTPAYAAAHAENGGGSAGGEVHLKSECWYVLDAEPGAVLYLGFCDGVTADDYEAAVRAGRVAEVLREVPAVVGELHDLPSGTIHALGAGVLVAEVQTPSDTTFRVHDWHELYERPERAMHVEEALASTLFEAAPAPIASADDEPDCELVSNAFYRVREVRGHCEARSLRSAGCCAVLCVGGMGCELVGAFGEVPMRVGTTVLVPAACAPGAELRMGPGAVCLVAEVV